MTIVMGIDQHRAQITGEWIDIETGEEQRARVRLRHTLMAQRSEWQQRIQAVLYHHGCPHRRQLMVGDGRDWLDASRCPRPRVSRSRSRSR